MYSNIAMFAMPWWFYIIWPTVAGLFGLVSLAIYFILRANWYAATVASLFLGWCVFGGLFRMTSFDTAYWVGWVAFVLMLIYAVNPFRLDVSTPLPAKPSK